ncbi:MAG: DHH family phosphoesterase [Candidatus Lokiarchaeota archaeon]|jgi:single-stranded DNA-specific DHH superfamily exonuclease|nr:DHH family phosphoesterase [Candidatus Lokiarchaeota archaeon]
MTRKPDRNKFLENLNSAVDFFEDYSHNLYNNVVAISHNDADGISSLQIIQNLLHKMKFNYDYFIYNRSVSWANYLSGILPRNHTNKTALIFTDVGSNLSELVPIIKERKEHFYILDHHEVDYDLDVDDLPENLFFVNPTVFGFDGLDHVSGATLAYMFAKKINLSIIKQGWLAVIGIAGDSLKSMEKLQSFNKEIYQEICDEELVIDREGLILFGGMHDSIKNGLKNSILPFLNGFGGEDDQKIKLFLDKFGISPNKKVVDLTQAETENILKNSNIKVGHYAILPQKQGLLNFAFEHAVLLNILSFKNISAAISIMQQKSITRYAKEIYYEYINALSKNLKLLANELPRYETKNAIFIDAGNGKIPPSNWSDTASFTSVNGLLEPSKMLFFGGLEKKTQMVKLSIRCSRKYLENNSKGVNHVINTIKQKLGGTGGGHKLAGGIRLSIPSFKLLKENVDKFI